MTGDVAQPKLSETERAVLWALHQAGETTRADIRSAVNLSKPTVGNAVSALESSHLVQAIRSQQGSLGRSATVYAIAASAGWVLGASVETNRVRVRACLIAGH